MEVDVSHLKPDEHKPYARRIERSHLRSADGLSSAYETSEQVRFEIEPMVDLPSRHNQRVPWTKWPAGKKGHAEGVLPYEIPRQLAADDAGEDACHSISLKSQA